MDKNQQGHESQQKSTGFTKAALLKILVPVLIVAVIAGIFIIKNAGRDSAVLPPAGNTDSADGTDYTSQEFVLDATDDLDMEKLLAYGLPVLIDFGADSCIPCKEMAPVLKELNEELRGKAIVKFVDVWKNPDAAQSVPLSVIPTQFFFNADGTPYVPEDAKSSAAKGFKMYSTRDTEEHVFTAHEGGMSKNEILAVLKEMGVQ